MAKRRGIFTNPLTWIAAIGGFLFYRSRRAPAMVIVEGVIELGASGAGSLFEVVDLDGEPRTAEMIISSLLSDTVVITVTSDFTNQAALSEYVETLAQAGMSVTVQ